MKIYLTRHGETAWNKQMIIQGTTDNPLNQTGIDQAYKIKEFFEEIEIDIVVSSSLMRARETASIATGFDPDIIDDRFIERNFGFFEGKDVSLFYEAKAVNQMRDIEDDKSLITRVTEGLYDYGRSAQNTIAIFAHSHVLKAALTHIQPQKYDFASHIKNCAIVELDYNNGILTLVDIH